MEDARILREERWDFVLEALKMDLSQPLVMQRVGQDFVPDEALGKRLLRKSHVNLPWVGRPAGRVWSWKLCGGSLVWNAWTFSWCKGRDASI